MSDDATGAAQGTERTCCPLCGGRETRARPLRRPQLLECRRCGLVYRLVPIAPVFGGRRDTRELEAVATSRARLLEELLRRLDPTAGARLVDIGCGAGHFLELAESAGWTAIGLELDRWLAQRTRRGGGCVALADAEDVSLQNNVAGAVTLWDVLDHCEVPQRAVAEVARVLRPGGALCLRVRHGRIHEMMRRQRWLPRAFSVLHNNMFSPRCLRRALTAAGFEEVRVEPSPTSRGDPYDSGRGWLGVAKLCWDLVARVAARLSRGHLIVSPSILVVATRVDALPPDHGRA